VQGKKGVHQQGNRRRKKNLQLSCHQTELRSLEATLKEKDVLVTELRESLTKRGKELEQVRGAAFEFKEIIDQVQAQNKDMQEFSTDKLQVMIDLEQDNKILKKAVASKEHIIEAKVGRNFEKKKINFSRNILKNVLRQNEINIFSKKCF